MGRRLTSIAFVALGVAAGAVSAEARPAVTRVHGIATGIAAFWRPLHGDDAALARSMVSAIRDCTPLHFSAQLGSAIAGQVLDIRFIGRGRETIVAPP
jgi:hypothetical protein